MEATILRHPRVQRQEMADAEECYAAVHSIVAKALELPQSSQRDRKSLLLQQGIHPDATEDYWPTMASLFMKEAHLTERDRIGIDYLADLFRDPKNPYVILTHIMDDRGLPNAASTLNPKAEGHFVVIKGVVLSDTPQILLADSVGKYPSPDPTRWGKWHKDTLAVPERVFSKRWGDDLKNPDHWIALIKRR